MKLSKNPQDASHKLFPMLYAKASNGKIKQWQIEANEDVMIIHSGYVDGKIKSTPPKIIKGKNIGKSNETTPAQQCLSECQSKWNKKIDEQYIQSLSKVGDYAEAEVILPMLAHSFEERKHKINYPCYVQPKLNGVRCLYQNKQFISRKGKEFTTLNHLVDELNKLGLDIPDGEIYIHGMTFQQIIRLVKKIREDGSNSKLEYWIYDEVDKNPFGERNQIIHNAFKGKKILKLKQVETVEVNSEEEIKKYHDKWVKEGFEGVIIRNTAGLYAIKHRSVDLQKYKEFFDEEFTITGAHEGSGTEAGTAVFEVAVTNTAGEERTLNVRPRGTKAIRQTYLREIEDLKGKQLTVRFQQRSEDGVPIFPVGIAIRDYE